MFQVKEVLAFREHEVLIRRRPYKRTIGITLEVNGRIQVSAPRRTTYTEIKDFLARHSVWIENNLAKYKAIREKYPRKEYREGEKFIFLGENKRLRFMPGNGAKVRVEVKETDLVVSIPFKEWITFDSHQPHPELANPVRAFYAEAGRNILSTRLRHFSERMGLVPSSVCFRSQKTRWGSCSASGRISLNWRLVVAPLEVIDYVIVHELSHLVHYNHSMAFWNLVATEIPDHEAKRKWLRENQYEADFLAARSELHPNY